MSSLFNVADSRKRPVWSEPFYEDVKTEIVHETELQGHKVEVYKTTVTTHKLRVYPMPPAT